MARILTLLTDFGLADYYVGAVKGTVLRLAPGAQLVDLSHEVAPGDVEGAADLLAAAAPTFPAGTVHLAVVDPGVGSARRLLVVASGGQHFVAPDNGLLTPQLRAGGEAWSVSRRDLFLDDAGGLAAVSAADASDGARGEVAPAGATFHGRDRFAPVAAALLRGDRPDTLGGPIDDAVRLAVPEPRRERRGNGWVLHGRVVRVDRFGNLISDLPAAWLDVAPGAARVMGHVGEPSASAGQPNAASAEPSAASGEPGAAAGEPKAASGEPNAASGERRLHRVRFYDELPAGEAGVLAGSLGTLELSLRGESLAARWGVGRGAAIRLELP